MSDEVQQFDQKFIQVAKMCIYLYTDTRQFLMTIVVFKRVPYSTDTFVKITMSTKNNPEGNTVTLCN